MTCMSWRRLLKTKTKDVFKTSSRRLHQDECLLGCFLFEKYCVKCLKALTEVLLFHGECINLTILKQRLQIFIKYSKCFSKAIVDTVKGEFRNSSYLLIWQFCNNSCSYSLGMVNTFARVTFGTVLFFQSIVVFEDSFC